MPVESDASTGAAALLRVQDQLAADGPDVWIGEGLHQRRQRGGLDPLPRIGEHDDLAGQPRQQVVEHGGLAAAMPEGDHLDALRGMGAGDCRGVVSRAVGSDNDIQSLRRIIERKTVADLRIDGGSFVVRHNQEADRRLRRLLPNRPPLHHGQDEDDERIPRVGIDQQGGGRPERDQSG